MKLRIAVLIFVLAVFFATGSLACKSSLESENRTNGKGEKLSGLFSKKNQTLNWSSYRGNPQRTGSTTNSVKPPFRVRWKRSSMSFFDVNLDFLELPQPTIDDGHIYYVNDNSKREYLSAIDSETGKEIWNYQFRKNETCSGSPEVYKGRVYVSSFEISENFESSLGRVSSIDAKTGKRIWNFETEDNEIFEANESCTILQGRLYIGSIGFVDGAKPKVYALDTKTGKKIWSYSDDSDEKYYYHLVADSGRIYVQSAKVVYALDARKGDIIWRYEAEDYLIQPPTLEAESLFIVERNAESTQVCALNGKTGALLWKSSLDIAVGSGLAVADTRVYVCSPIQRGKIGTVYCLNAKNGNKIWSYKARESEGFNAPPSIANGYVFVASGTAFEEGRIYALDAETGDEVWSYKSEQEDGFMSPLAIGEGFICFMSSNRSVLSVHRLDDSTISGTPDQPYLYSDISEEEWGKISRVLCLYNQKIIDYAGGKYHDANSVYPSSIEVLVSNKYLKKTPVEPSGGTYSISGGGSAECSINGH